MNGKQIPNPGNVQFGRCSAQHIVVNDQRIRAAFAHVIHPVPSANTSCGGHKGIHAEYCWQRHQRELTFPGNVFTQINGLPSADPKDSIHLTNLFKLTLNGFDLHVFHHKHLGRVGSQPLLDQPPGDFHGGDKKTAQLPTQPF